MGKLFKLKEWLTIADAAKHLSSVFEEEVTDADVLRFALDDELQISVNFINEAYCRAGSLVPISEASFEDVPSLKIGGSPVRLFRGPRISTDGVDTHILELEGEVCRLVGVYDLPLIGGERIDLENRYQQLTGGPEVTAVPMDGAFVRAQGGQLCQLQDDYEDNEHCAGSRAQLEAIKGYIERKDCDEAERMRLIAKHREARAKCIEQRASRPLSEHFYPLGHLPADVVFVVRTDALAQFIEMVNARERGKEDLAAAPFFDADSEDYPGLLHIAVRAWEHARTTSSGTPKKRIIEFVTERYPHVSEGAKESIALIANWQKAPGRPKTGG